MPVLQACLNGLRDHPAAPRRPDALAADARTAVEAGAACFHVHAYGRDGRESLAPEPVAETLLALRAACPGIPISLSTASYIEPDPERRLAFVESWTELPDAVTANMSEDRILELCDLAIARGVGVEAGLLSADDARAFISSGMASRSVRALVEALDEDEAEAVARAEAIEDVLAEAGIRVEQVHHGLGMASWAIQRRAAGRGHGIRAGLEDLTVLPDGRGAAGNSDILAAAAAILARAQRA
jgi:uncharacterized protein (DUF849 family)